MTDFDFGGADFNGGSASEPDATATLDGAVALAEEFIEGVVWGDHNRVWKLIGGPGRDEVLDVATRRGMDEGLAARLRNDTGSPGETNEFLADLVNGLRSELAGNDLDNISYELEKEQPGPGKAAVRMFVPLHPRLGGTLPIGTLFLGVEVGAWRVERLIPLTSK